MHHMLINVALGWVYSRITTRKKEDNESRLILYLAKVINNSSIYNWLQGTVVICVLPTGSAPFSIY